MNKPRIFLGSSGKQAKLLQAITRGLEDVADVEPWTTTFNPGRSTLDRLVELSQEVDFAAFVFAQDDWTTTDASESGQASPPCQASPVKWGSSVKPAMRSMEASYAPKPYFHCEGTRGSTFATGASDALRMNASAAAT